MRTRKRHNIEEIGLSFLDVVCCGFGAVILLLMIAKVTEPMVLEQTERQLQGSVADLQKQLFEIRGETRILNRDLTVKREQLSEITEKLARLKGGFSDLSGRLAVLRSRSESKTTRLAELEQAKQQLTEEMRRLLGRDFVRQDATIAGVPVDSEYIIFVIDTSPSMRNFAWQRLRKEMIDILDVYPEVKGLQVLNDNGQYMFGSIRGRWIEDTETRRRAIIRKLATWKAFSESNPEPGIKAAIRRFYRPDRKISIYVLGDEFSSTGSITQVVNAVDRLNKSGAGGERLVRIHGIGFPVLFSNRVGRGSDETGVNFAILMREIAKRNNGSFVGLNDFK